MSLTSMLAGIVGGRPAGPAPVDLPAPRSGEPPPARRALTIRRCEPEEGPAFWRWDCAACGEYGGGRHHPDAITRAMRHCHEHPEHRSSLLPPVRCRKPDNRLAVHPALYAMDDDPPPAPLSS